MTINQYIEEFPKRVISGTVTEDSVLPYRIPRYQLIHYFSNGKAKSLKAMTPRQKWFLTRFLFRIKRAFGPDVDFDKDAGVVFRTRISVKEWNEKTHCQTVGYGKGTWTTNGKLIKESINNLLTYVIKNEVARLSQETINYITFGINIAKVNAGKIVYNDKDYMDYPTLFSALGLEAKVVETKPRKAKEYITRRSKAYGHDLSPFGTLDLVLEYDDIEQVKKAQEKLKKLKVVSGHFTRRSKTLASVVLPDPYTAPVPTSTSAEEAKINKKVDEILSGTPDEIRKYIFNSVVDSRIYEEQKELCDLYQKKIAKLEKENADKDNYISAAFGE